MGGGALMTPMLIFFFGVDPLTAISSDIVVSLFMKPVGAFVHLRHGTVNLKLVGWLCLGLGAVRVHRRVADLARPRRHVRSTSSSSARSGVALLIATGGLLLRAVDPDVAQPAATRRGPGVR